MAFIDVRGVAPRGTYTDIVRDAIGLNDDKPATVADVMEAGPDEIQSPLDGELVDVTDIDALISLYERVDQFDKQCFRCKQLIREALGNLTEGDAKTRRVQGEQRKAKLEFPSDNWDQSILREAFQSYPQYRDEFLRIEKLAPRLRDVRKLINTTGSDALNTFRDMVVGARRPSTAPPTLKIEQ